MSEITPAPSGRTKLPLIVVLLALATFAALGHVTANGFVDYDDDKYVTQNDRVREGLTADGIQWAFTTTSMVNWHPLTWISFELEYAIYGPRAWGFHLTNLLFHIANTVLLFGVFWKMTGALWRCALMSALFALHPLHVESVAWISERKDVLSTFFWMLTLWAYVAYVEKPRPLQYLTVVVALGLGLMAKPMLVTLPCVLLLLDYWPLARWVPGARACPASLSRCLAEKLPLLALASVSSAITLVAQHRSQVPGPLAQLPGRVALALVSYVRYLGKTIWPTGLIPFYPYPPQTYSPAQAGLAALLLVVITFLAIRWMRRRPYFLVGWLWYLGTLVPVIGLVEILGGHSLADRYTYVPLIGLFIICSWGLADVAERRPRGRPLLAGAAVAGLAICSVLSWMQVRYWRDDIALWEHTLGVDPDNYVAHNGLGLARVRQDQPDLAIVHFAETVRLNPRYGQARNNLGALLERQGKLDDAIANFREAVLIDPRDAESRMNLGLALLKQGKLPEAEQHLAEAARLQPNNAACHANLGLCLRRQGRLEEAIRHYEKALQLRPDFAEAHNNLGAVLAGKDRLEEAGRHFREAARLDPNDADACSNLARLLEMQGRGEEARQWQRRAAERQRK